MSLTFTGRYYDLEDFLFRSRAGHCEYFSTAMAVLAHGSPGRKIAIQ